jgi:hypothetical protein
MSLEDDGILGAVTRMVVFVVAFAIAVMPWPSSC